ncbi:MAG: AAA family ATPase [Patescibacteria group bacterium]|nr:AAA family ATPase [Patescibacteria group bacterium]MDE2015327.1 AAA family ATPase [Patescibacteria group bacterium]MDE2227132.1 AAA family ATPase [Patescibacteria group bacterium]
MDNEILIVGLTGGPCSGKTSVLSSAAEKLAEYGFDTYLCNEAATFLIMQGMLIKKAVHAEDWQKVQEYQKEIMDFTHTNEERMRRCAMIEGRKSVVLSDRPLPDTRAYLPEGSKGDEIYVGLLREITGFTPPEALDRYHSGVIKLTTAADGAEEFYTLENNAARDEPPEVARYLDKRIQETYTGLEHLKVIDNSTDFETKKKRALQAICQALGIPEPLENERKYIVSYPSPEHFLIPYRKIEIEQAYLLDDEQDGEPPRIRKRTYQHGSTYFWTKKKPRGPGVRVEIEKAISWRTYLELMDSRDQKRGVIKKHRYCFFWENQYFALDVFNNLPKALCLLEIELTDLQQKVVLPPFLKVSEKDDVSDDNMYSNSNLALLIA